ncbi:unnamed protein product [Didymodactylos carnosus]|uniref:Uncharacterized protein n=1 Tax=Didymodactylos carnosus TaxID=1234261 RepID=A0A813W907_9BILA|nr:unnamed protein product [Didymodactylos carnosus]CAF1548868.1 unnamed protein product [Didymodactylos carnosus]CAF3639315.1 unnamed protein product [Didymodactylos carnosus]CAF4338546.1 unnamed protein product [Didymodactylos carnosus]
MDEPTNIITQSNNPIFGVYNTTTGGSSKPSSSGAGACQYPSTEDPVEAIDNMLATKYTNFGSGKSGVSSATKGVGTGFYVIPSNGPSVLNGFQFATANKLPLSNPLTVTIEGSNLPALSLTSGSSWTLLYNGPTGIPNTDPGRNVYCSAQAINNTNAYSSYRLLITSQLGSDTNVQYAEIHLLGYFPGGN